MKYPKYIEKIKEHLRECNFERRCLSCGNIIAFAVIQLENGFLEENNFDIKRKKSHMLWKFFQSLSNLKNQCHHALSIELINKMDSWLNKQSKETLEYFRDIYLYSNAEFKSKNNPNF